MIKDPFAFIHHIFDAITDIEKYKKDTPTLDDLIRDVKTQDAIIRKLEIVGEATRNLPEEFRNKYPEVNWKGPINLRNIFSHEYFELSLKTIWNLFDNDLPTLKRQLGEILKDENSGSL